MYDALPRHNVKVIICNMNAKWGQKEGYRPTIGVERLHSILNNNGTRLLNFVTSYQ